MGQSYTCVTFEVNLPSHFTCLSVILCLPNLLLFHVYALHSCLSLALIFGLIKTPLYHSVTLKIIPMAKKKRTFNTLSYSHTYLVHLGTVDWPCVHLPKGCGIILICLRTCAPPEIRAQLVEQQKCLDQQTDMRVQLLQDLQDFFRKKSEIEMEYSRNLEKLAERFMAKTRSTKDHQQYK